MFALPRSVSFIAAWSLLLAAPATGAVPEKPPAVNARWSGETWGIVQVAPRMARHGDQIHIHGMVVGGAPANPWWSCSQYHGWLPNGTSQISLIISGDWQMPYSGIDIFDNKVNVQQKDGGPKPPYGWANRISDTCYCEVTGFGATGGCESREIHPDLFLMMDRFNPRAGNVQFATVTSRAGWYPVQALFEGYAGVGWSDRATDYVYVVGEAELADDADADGLADAWEYAHAPDHGLDQFSGGPVDPMTDGSTQSAPAWVSPYAPREPGWVSAGPNDFDGDGISNLAEYRGWRDRRTDGAGLPFDPTVINVPPVDPVTTTTTTTTTTATTSTTTTFVPGSTTTTTLIAIPCAGLSGFAGVQCICDEGVPASCAADRVPAAVGRFFKRGCRASQHAARLTKARKVTRAIRSADAAFAKALAKARKAAQRLSPLCNGSLTETLADAKGRLPSM